MPKSDLFSFKQQLTATTLTVERYQTESARTDRFEETAHPLDLPLLGLTGEIGSLVAEVKKRQRGDLPNDAYRDSVLEELGDCLWYFSAVCRRLNVDFRELVSSISKPSDRALKFSDCQAPFHVSTLSDAETLLEESVALTAAVGAFNATYLAERSTFDTATSKSHAVTVLRALLSLASAARVSVQDAAVLNLRKISDRWPNPKNYPPLLDAQDVEAEQLPRKLMVDIFERKVGSNTYVYQRCNGINIGDPLTDNKEDPDDYRFHDVFHYAYAAILGWSPVMRALFKLKRKSNKSKDENQDGARAILIEEGIATWVFEQGLGQDLFEGVVDGKLSYDLLKTVKQFVSGYEVGQCPVWLWEEAILEGFKCFRFLKEHRRGRLTLNLSSRTIDIGDLL